MCPQDQTIIRLRNDADIAASKHKRVLDNLKAVQMELSSAEEDLRSKHAEAEALNAQLAEHHQELGSLQQAMHALRAEVGAEQHALHALHAEVGTAQQAHARILAETASAQAQLDGKQNQLQRLEAGQQRLSQDEPSDQVATWAHVEHSCQKHLEGSMTHGQQATAQVGQQAVLDAEQPAQQGFQVRQCI